MSSRASVVSRVPGSTTEKTASSVAHELELYPEDVPAPRQRRFKSSRLIGEYEKPWKGEKIPRKSWDSYIFWGCIVIGIAIGGFLCYQSWTSVPQHEYCLVLEDNFEKLDTSIWNHEIQRGGFGTGSFDWTTDDPKNAYVDSKGLHIVPTLTIDTTNITVQQLLDGYVLNMTKVGGDASCTEKDFDNSACSIRSNSTSGDIINPVRSARLNTRGKKTIRYGKVEVVAKMPRGDWLWPAIWMMPQDEVYGAWPRSGEIDILEARGNKGGTFPDGRDSALSALHWGPLPAADGFWRTTGKHTLRRQDYSDVYHTYGLEWSENYLFTYIDSRLLQVLYVSFKKYKSMWDRGKFGGQLVNHTALFDPWSQTHKPNTPFDQDFYLILNVAVGATNGFFSDGEGNKPWGDQSLTAPLQFWQAQSTWYPTWGEGDTRGMTVKSVKMWSEGACK